MRATFELKEDTAKRLRSLAEQQQLSIEELLVAHIPGLKSVKSSADKTDDTPKIKELGQWIRSFPKNSPPLSDEATSRASIYCDR